MGNWLRGNGKHSENSRKKLKIPLKNCKTGRRRRENSHQAAQQKSPIDLKWLDISIKRTLKIGHRLRWFCAIQQRQEPVTFFMSQALGAPEETRTPDLLIRSQTLYPAELPALVHRVCRGTYIIIPSAFPNVKQFFKVFCKKTQKDLFSAFIRHTFSFQTPHGRILLAVLRQTSYTISVYYGFGCDFL